VAAAATSYKIRQQKLRQPQPQPQPQPQLNQQPNELLYFNLTSKHIRTLQNMTHNLLCSVGANDSELAILVRFNCARPNFKSNKFYDP
jgi:hypothetical protein